MILNSNSNNERTCKICGKTLSINMFYKRFHKLVNNGYIEYVYHNCKKCELEKRKNRIGKEKIVRKNLKELTNEERIEYKKQQQKQWHEENKEHISELNKLYRINNREQCNSAQKKWYINNKDRYLKSVRIRYSERYVTDPNYKLKKTICCKIKQTISGRKKYKHSIELLGCSINDVRSHLERQFLPGMTWDNWNLYGWHIDHIIPISFFDLTKEEDQKQCFHYTNLQPLWALDNITKSNKIIEKQLILL